jgi:hypothetical protein
MSIFLAKIDASAKRVDAIDMSRKYVDLDVFYRHILSIGRSDRHQCDPGGENPSPAGDIVTATDAIPMLERQPPERSLWANYISLAG